MIFVKNMWIMIYDVMFDFLVFFFIGVFYVLILVMGVFMILKG